MTGAGVNPLAQLSDSRGLAAGEIAPVVQHKQCLALVQPILPVGEQGPLRFDESLERSLVAGPLRQVQPDRYRGIVIAQRIMRLLQRKQPRETSLAAAGLALNDELPFRLRPFEEIINGQFIARLFADKVPVRQHIRLNHSRANFVPAVRIGIAQRCPGRRHLCQRKLNVLYDLSQMIQPLTRLCNRLGLRDLAQQVFHAKIVGIVKPAAEINPVTEGEFGDHLGGKVARDDRGNGKVTSPKILEFGATIR